jgi:hypothetical protein
MGLPENGKQNGGDDGRADQGSRTSHRQNAKGIFSVDALDVGGGLVFLVFSGVFHVAGGWFHIVGFLFDFLVVLCGLTIITHHVDKQYFKLFGFRYWLALIVTFGIFSALAVHVVLKENASPFPPTVAESKPVTNAIGWLPPELPSGCSNVTVWFGAWRMDEPVWLAKTPHEKFDTNHFGKNSFTVQVSPNLNLTMYHWGDIATDSNAIRYAITDLPPSFVTNAETMPDYSPRKRSFSFNGQVLKTPWIKGKSIDFPVWPIVISNRLFVDVMIPFTNERHRILMDASLDNALTNLPSRWDVNYDSNKFEVVNEDTNPVLQVVYKSATEVQVNGIYVVNGFDIYAAFNSLPVTFFEEMGDNATQMMEIEDFEKLHTNISVKITDTNVFFQTKFSTAKLLFKYPSWRFFHKTAD